MAIGRKISLTPNVKSKKINVTATAGQTLFTVTGGYRVNNISVYRNGALLATGADFLANDGSTVTLLTPATVGDIVQFEVFDTHEIADALNQNGDQTLNGQLTASSGFTIGITSAGTLINQSAGTVSGISSLNFVGTGNTFSYESSSKTIDISISGSGGGGLGKPVGDTDSIFNYIERFATETDDITLDTTNAGVNTSIVVTTNPRIVVSDSKTVTVGAAKTLVVDILQIDSLFDA